MSIAETREYGRGWAFPLRFDNSSVQMVAGADDVEQGLRILFLTQPGERIMRADFGCGLNQFAFASIEAGIETEIAAMIAEGIRRYEPRITVLSVSVIPVGELRNQIKVTIEYAHALGANVKKIEWLADIGDGRGGLG